MRMLGVRFLSPAPLSYREPGSLKKLNRRYPLEGFPSGQRDQTVNLTSKTSEVRILPPPPFKLAGEKQGCLAQEVFDRDKLRERNCRTPKRKIHKVLGISPTKRLYAGVAQLARASAFQAEGRGFESRFPLHLPGCLKTVTI